MTKKQLKELINFTITNGYLDVQKVESIAQVLKRKELKQYIKALKAYERERNVVVNVAQPLKDEEKDKIASIFTNKHIIYKTDPSIILGAKIIEEDMEYDISLKRNLERIVSHITTAYD